MLTNGWQDEAPSWAPDSEWLVFQRTQQTTGVASLAAVTVGGGEAKATRHAAARRGAQLVGSSAMIRAAGLLPALLASRCFGAGIPALSLSAAAAGQGYPQPAPGYPPMQGPVLAIPVLEADLRAKAGIGHGPLRARFLRAHAAVAGDADGAGAVADPAPVRSREHRGPCRQPANPRLCAGARRAARRRGPQLSDRFRSSAAAAADRQLGPGAADDRHGPRRDLATEQPRRNRLEAAGVGPTSRSRSAAAA